MKIALDSNILLYAAGVWKAASDPDKSAIIRPLIDQLDLSSTIVCPWQVFGECYSVLLRHGHSRDECRTVIRKWQEKFATISSSEIIFDAALDLATEHKLQFWDALILSAADEAGCSLLLSEDLQPGFKWRGTTVVNPFAKKMDVRLKRVMEG